ncbi:putative nicotinate-nucleotide adenylyltransferase [Clostridium omnivorum]|uniref:Probable nicotinate-nucleotide adenylyltransferase n=2 Tax=Clostridium omnivorum TaxID=1604902 RepID=A0ABQ5NAJ3_9CLOT|nr:putative nicotinate-nucleotide adenylyltransferase [Clostridium sp. E14]
MNKAIFGGTFDPIHNGHIHIAYNCLYALNMDEIIFMPSGNPPHKTDKEITDAGIRYELVKMATRSESRFKVSDFEINNKELSYTYKTLEHFKNLEPDTQWWFLTGADCLIELDMWKSVDRILEASNLIVFSRPGHDKKDIIEQKKRVENIYNKKITFLEVPLMDISSTYIKNEIREGKNISYMMPEGVYNSILQLKLYK